VSVDPEGDWPTVDEPAPATPHCLWIKITQILGEVSCYLLPVHDGNHCSADWMEWS
jgi:hypothetical protein